MTYELYRKDAKAGEKITIGMIAQSGCVNVIAAAVVYQAPTEPMTEATTEAATEATTEAPTEPTTEPATAAQTVIGDVDGNGVRDEFDLVMLQRWLLDTGSLTAPR